MSAGELLGNGIWEDTWFAQGMIKIFKSDKDVFNSQLLLRYIGAAHTLGFVLSSEFTTSLRTSGIQANQARAFKPSVVDTVHNGDQVVKVMREWFYWNRLLRVGAQHAQVFNQLSILKLVLTPAEAFQDVMTRFFAYPVDKRDASCTDGFKLLQTLPNDNTFKPEIVVTAAAMASCVDAEFKWINTGPLDVMDYLRNAIANHAGLQGYVLNPQFEGYLRQAAINITTEVESEAFATKELRNLRASLLDERTEDNSNITLFAAMREYYYWHKFVETFAKPHFDFLLTAKWIAPVAAVAPAELQPVVVKPPTPSYITKMSHAKKGSLAAAAQAQRLQELAELENQPEMTTAEFMAKQGKSAASASSPSFISNNLYGTTRTPGGTPAFSPTDSSSGSKKKHSHHHGHTSSASSGAAADHTHTTRPPPVFSPAASSSGSKHSHRPSRASSVASSLGTVGYGDGQAAGLAAAQQQMSDHNANINGYTGKHKKHHGPGGASYASSVASLGTVGYGDGLAAGLTAAQQQMSDHNANINGYTGKHKKHHGPGGASYASSVASSRKSHKSSKSGKSSGSKKKPANMSDDLSTIASGDGSESDDGSGSDGSDSDGSDSDGSASDSMPSLSDGGDDAFTPVKKPTPTLSGINSVSVSDYRALEKQLDELTASWTAAQTRVREHKTLIRELQDEKTRENEKLEKLQRESTSLGKQLKDEQQKTLELTKAGKELKKRYDALETRKEELKSTIAAGKIALAAMETKFNDAKDDKVIERDVQLKRARGELAEAVEAKAAAESKVQKEVAKVTAAKRELLELENQKTKVDRALVQLNSELDSAKELQTNAESAAKGHEKTIERLKGELLSKQNEIDNMERDHKRRVSALDLQIVDLDAALKGAGKGDAKLISELAEVKELVADRDATIRGHVAKEKQQAAEVAQARDDVRDAKSAAARSLAASASAATELLRVQEELAELKTKVKNGETKEQKEKKKETERQAGFAAKNLKAKNDADEALRLKTEELASAVREFTKSRTKSREAKEASDKVLKGRIAELEEIGRETTAELDAANRAKDAFELQVAQLKPASSSAAALDALQSSFDEEKEKVKELKENNSKLEKDLAAALTSAKSAAPSRPSLSTAKKTVLEAELEEANDKLALMTEAKDKAEKELKARSKPSASAPANNLLQSKLTAAESEVKSLKAAKDRASDQVTALKEERAALEQVVLQLKRKLGARPSAAASSNASMFGVPHFGSAFGSGEEHESKAGRDDSVPFTTAGDYTHRPRQGLVIQRISAKQAYSNTQRAVLALREMFKKNEDGTPFVATSRKSRRSRFDDAESESSSDRSRSSSRSRSRSVSSERDESSDMPAWYKIVDDYVKDKEPFEFYNSYSEELKQAEEDEDQIVLQSIRAKYANAQYAANNQEFIALILPFQSKQQTEEAGGGGQESDDDAEWMQDDSKNDDDIDHEPVWWSKLDIYINLNASKEVASQFAQKVYDARADGDFKLLKELHEDYAKNAVSKGNKRVSELLLTYHARVPFLY